MGFHEEDAEYEEIESPAKKVNPVREEDTEGTVVDTNEE